jgi:hypothetical protein
MHTYRAPGLPIPYFTPGDVYANVRTTTSWIPAKSVVFYGGLGALTVAGALEWPVALAIAGATSLVRSNDRAKEAPKEALKAPEEPQE